MDPDRVDPARLAALGIDPHEHARLQQLGAEREALNARLEEIRAEAEPLIVKLASGGTRNDGRQRLVAEAYRVEREWIRLLVKRLTPQ